MAVKSKVSRTNEISWIVVYGNDEYRLTYTWEYLFEYSCLNLIKRGHCSREQCYPQISYCFGINNITDHVKCYRNPGTYNIRSISPKIRCKAVIVDVDISPKTTQYFKQFSSSIYNENLLLSTECCGSKQTRYGHEVYCAWHFVISQFDVEQKKFYQGCSVESTRNNRRGISFRGIVSECRKLNHIRVKL